MSPGTEDHRQRVALFRYGVIAGLLVADRRAIGAMIRELSQRIWVIPGTRRNRIAEGTIRDWLHLYRKHGFEGLCPKRRRDRARPRRMTPETIELVLSIKRDAPHLSVREVIRQARESGELADDATLASSTLYRLFAAEGLDKPADTQARDLRRFTWPGANDLWMADVLHGPKVKGAGGRRFKTYLIAFIDDATRIIPFAAFAMSENTASFLPVFREALMRRGLPVRLYVDNGSYFRSTHLSLVCARLGIVLIHATPYRPMGKGKIERWLRTVRIQLLPRLQNTDLASLETLNLRLRTWIEGDYHRAPHRGLGGMTPFDKWASLAADVPMLGPTVDLDDIFLFEVDRRVHKDRTVSLRNRLYEAPAELVGHKVTLRFDPARLDRPVRIVHDGRDAGVATPLDVHANALIRRTLTFRPHDDEETS